jgi:hypothetical protein
MTEAEIQAIVGFIRQWESTAPEVAVPAKGGGGGPPWMRSTTTTSGNTTGSNSTSAAAGQAAGQQSGAGTQGQGHAQGQGQAAQSQPAWWQTLDWRILLLITGGLSVALTLIFMGFEALRPKKPKDG